jgi:hypothetical protein
MLRAHFLIFPVALPPVHRKCESKKGCKTHLFRAAAPTPSDPTRSNISHSITISCENRESKTNSGKCDASEEDEVKVRDERRGEKGEVE